MAPCALYHIAAYFPAFGMKTDVVVMHPAAHFLNEGARPPSVYVSDVSVSSGGLYALWPVVMWLAASSHARMSRISKPDGHAESSPATHGTVP